MDEILIGEQKYVSSKRAADITGYAKDYIGQLCREGRVEARLVGRNWYVREAAIKDHRFGEENAVEVKIEPVETPLTVEDDKETIEESPQEIEMPANTEEELEIVGGEGSLNIAEQMQEAWRDWFTQNSAPQMAGGVIEEDVFAKDEPTYDQEALIVEEKEESGAVPIMITQIEDAPEAPIEPVMEEMPDVVNHSEPEASKIQRKAYSYVLFKSFLALVALLFIVVTVLGTNVLDINKYIDQTSTASVANFISGTGIYIK